MKKRKKKMNETDKIIIAVLVLIISIGYALITSSFNTNNIKTDTIKKEEYIYTVNMRNTIYLNKSIDDSITVYKTSSSARKAFSNNSIYLKHKVKNNIKWSVSDNENTFLFDLEKECKETIKNNNYPELLHATCKKQILREVKESYIGFAITDKIKKENPSVIIGEYFIRGGLSKAYSNNIEIMKKTFGETLCVDNSSSYSCAAGNLKITIFDNGSVTATEDHYSCNIDSDGSSYCNE